MLLQLAVLAIVGPMQEAPTQPLEFLLWSMDKYKAMKSLHVESSLKAPEDPFPSARSFHYTAPNKFNALYIRTVDSIYRAVSDGQHVFEFREEKNTPGSKYLSPASLATVESSFMTNPLVVGSLMHKFFGGRDGFKGLVDGAVRFDKDEVLARQWGKEDCRVVAFSAQGLYGNTRVVISKKSGLIYEIRYDLEPFRKAMKEMAKYNKEMAKYTNMKMDCVEQFFAYTIDKAIDDSRFVAQLPEGAQLQDLTAPARVEEPKPPVPLGTAAPDFTVFDLRGGPKRLSEMRGRVVLVDFWATWCPPCLLGLVHTEAFYKAYNSKGLEVMTVSDESAETVKAFIKDTNYTFPAYRDSDGAVSKKYGITALPTLLVIDANGNLVSYMVGYKDENTVLAELKKAGLTTR